VPFGTSSFDGDGTFDAKNPGASAGGSETAVISSDNEQVSLTYRPASYSFVLCDMTTGAVVDELVLPMGVNFSYLLNKPGAFSCEVPKNSRLPDGNQRVMYGNLYPASLALYVKRNTDVIWGGILWSLQSDSKSPTVKIIAKGWWEYFRHIRVGTIEIPTASTAAVCIPQVFDAIASYSAYRNVTYEYAVYGSDTQTTTLTVLASNYQMADSPLNTLMSSPARSDCQLQFIDSGSSIIPKFAFYIPYISNNRGNTLEYSVNSDGAGVGNLTDYNITFDGEKMMNIVTGLGQNAGNDSIKKTYVADYLVDQYGLYYDPLVDYQLLDYTTSLVGGLEPQKMPVMEGVYRRPDIVSPEYLAEITQRYAKQVVEPPALVTVTAVPGLISPTYISPGDSTRLLINDGFIQFDSVVRASQVTVKLGEDYTETVSISLAPQDV
jgi:hypothetical protein